MVIVFLCLNSGIRAHTWNQNSLRLHIVNPENQFIPSNKSVIEFVLPEIQCKHCSKSGILFVIKYSTHIIVNVYSHLSSMFIFSGQYSFFLHEHLPKSSYFLTNFLFWVPEKNKTMITIITSYTNTAYVLFELSWIQSKIVLYIRGYSRYTTVYIHC